MITILEGGITEVPGFRAAGVRAGIKRRGPDLMLIVSEDGPVPAAGAFTTNLVKGAPLIVTKEHLKKRQTWRGGHKLRDLELIHWDARNA